MAEQMDFEAKFSEVKKLISANEQPEPAIPAKTLTAQTLGKTIDHTILKLDATEEQVTAVCKEAIDYGFAAVCVRPNFVAHAVKQIQASGKTDIKVASTVGFHEGTYSTEEKLKESKNAIADGATEFDVVLNQDDLKAKRYTKVFEELKALRDVAPRDKVLIKLILETSQLSREEIIAASVIAGYARFDFIKTSTGFCGEGATVENVELMNSVAFAVGKLLNEPKMKVKASGGVRTLEDAKKMLDAGAERIGASAGVAIIKEFLGDSEAKASGSGY